jgi:heme-degrading monooxygenase HmoA
MYATIRRYTSKDPSKAKAAFTSLKGRIESSFVPTLHDVPGFHGYYVLNANDRELVTISIFESRAGAEESTRRAAEFVRSDPLKDQLSTPEIIEGDLLVAKEAAVGTH